MEFNKDIKQKVADIVENYTKNYPTEFANFIKQQKAKKANLKNDWAEVNGYQGVVIRMLNEYPETLAALFKIGLTDAEHMEFRGEKMQIWFGNKFRYFSAIDKKS